MSPSRVVPTRILFALALALAAALTFAQAAAGHAQLLGTSPTSGSTVSTQPKQVIFQFNQDVGGTAGAVRVYNAQGQEIDDHDVSHPNGNQHWMGVGLRSNLPDGTYTATYRVISADTHIVYGGLVFDLGHASATSKVTVAGLIGKDESGHVTDIAFGVTRAMNYLSLALMTGGLMFMLLVCPRALAAVGDGDLGEAEQALSYRLDRLLALAIVLGVLASVLGVLLQGASAAGLSLWSSLSDSVVRGTLKTRFGWVWGSRALIWLALATLLVLWHGSRSASARRGVIGPGLVLATIYLLSTPALAGHASVESPIAVFFPSDVIHVTAASVWVGGIVCLLVALPAATRRLEGARRTQLLLAVLTRFSPLALGSVVAIAITGVVQAYIDVRTLHGLLHTTYGALILVKTALLLGLIGLGWVNRQRVIPALERIAAAARAPGGIGRLVRRSMRTELALMLAVLGVTAALIGYAPPIDAENGPFSIDTSIGPALLEMTVEPAKVGLNTIHMYLIDAKTGAQYTATKELTVTAKLPSKGIGPLPLHANLAGPGHYVLDSAVLSPGGTWNVEVVDRVSEFEQYTRVVKVPIG